MDAANHDQDFAKLGEERLAKIVQTDSLPLELQDLGVEDWQKLASLYEEKSNYELAIQCYQKVLELVPESPFWLYRKLGELLTNIERIDEAISCYQKALDYYGDRAETYRCLGILQEKKGDVLGEIDSYQKALELDPQSAFWVYSTLGYLLKERGDVRGAISIYLQGKEVFVRRSSELCDKIFVLETNTPLSIYRDIAEELTKFNLFTEAIAILEKAIENYPDRAETYRYLGFILEKTNDIEGEIFNYQKAIALEPQQPHWLYSTLGYLLIKTNRLQEGIIAYKQAIYIEPEQPISLYFELEKKILQQDTLATIISFYREQIEKFTNSPNLNYNLGRLLINEAPEEAVFYLETAIKLAPSFWEAYQSLGDLALQQQNYERAEQNYNLAKKTFYRERQLEEADLPQDFDWEIYLDLNPDLNFYSKWSAIEHFLIYGRHEKRMYCLENIQDPERRPDIAPKTIVESWPQEISSTTKKLAVLVHVYYWDLWQELLSYIKNIDTEYDLFINIVESVWKPSIHETIRQDLPQGRILISKNRGRDIGGYLELMGHLELEKYDLFILLHTKKSPQNPKVVADLWRKNLLDAILGDKEKVQTNLAIMRNCPQFGLLGSRYWRSTSITQNSEKYTFVLDKLGIKSEARNCEYLSGTMMLVKAEILKPIYEKFSPTELENGDDRDLSFHLDGQLAHAIERAIGNLVKERGMLFFWQE
jgi:tetratricopeptide (TPR) repeat protein